MAFPGAPMAPLLVTVMSPVPATMREKTPDTAASIVPPLAMSMVPPVLPTSVSWALMAVLPVEVSVVPAATSMSMPPASWLTASRACHFERIDPPVTSTLTSPVFTGLT